MRDLKPNADLREQIRELVVAGVRNQEIHRRSARPLLEAVGFTSEQSWDLVEQAEEEM